MYCPAALRIACSAHSPRHTVEYVIYKLGKRLGNSSWLVALKALMTFHRLLRECDPSFQEQVCVLLLQLQQPWMLLCTRHPVQQQTCIRSTCLTKAYDCSA
eukprot:GHUV01053141.1.p1 GENE.GHUV01053141.1~~GHUV01053141.1.p1  ORF type:complete len:101 (-),score=28.09 GHUV01053141.1:165-467(-)